MHQGLVVIDTPEDYSSKMCCRCGEEVVEDPRRKRKRTHKDGKTDLVPVCGASTAATALLAEAFVAGIVITMLPSTSVPICCTTWSMAHGRSMAMLITTNPVGLVLPVNANQHGQTFYRRGRRYQGARRGGFAIRRFINKQDGSTQNHDLRYGSC